MLINGLNVSGRTLGWYPKLQIGKRTDEQVFEVVMRSYV